jgi:flagellar basal-body rod protein FlgB
MERVTMSSSFVIDKTMQAAKAALDGLSQRQNTISRNIANIDTPGYKAQEVNFEEALNKALKLSSNSLSMKLTHAAHLTAPKTQENFISLANRPGGSNRVDGNNVDLDVELTDMSETGVVYQAVTAAIKKKFDLLTTIASR